MQTRTPRRLGRMLAAILVVAALVTCARPGEDAARQTERTIQAAPGETAEGDARTAIAVDAATRQAVLKEMRTMLRAVQGIIGGAANWDTAAMRAAAATAGVAAASEAEPDVQRQLGPDFVQLGMRTHLSFDSLAAEVAAGNSRDAVMRRLASVMGNCVGCHEQWRLITPP